MTLNRHLFIGILCVVMPVRLTPWRISNEKTTGLDYFTCDNCGFYKLKRDVKIALEPLYDAAYKCKKSGCGHDSYVVKEASPKSKAGLQVCHMLQKNSCGNWIAWVETEVELNATLRKNSKWQVIPYAK